MGGGGVQLIMGTEAVVPAVVLHAVIAAELLQLAVARPHAGQAFFLMGGEDQLQRGAAGFLHLFGVGAHLHPFGNGIDTGGHQAAGAGGFHHADAAGADLVDILQIAKGGDFHPGIAGGLQNGGTFGHADSNAIDFYIHHIHCSALLSYFFTIASKRHFSKQAPHLMQADTSMTCA